ncbi:LamG domain-containing protein [Catenuloplanes indicus]|uniref:LamG-like jellyroll fold domain-containing protein n=1 Tax=Catenuloplanes indicus TaxID=137267 RepID=A0AAE3VVG7_9ACTN|nr:LamG domain-containing protein [Catenuloplanes indicus]MDQ0364778.1 hypothetical protein [Catenuloplanes indicus]
MTSPSWPRAHRRSRRGTASSIVLLVTAGVLPLWTPPAAAAPTAPAAYPRSEEATALATAVKSGQRVEVASERTAYAQVFADPSGKLVMESSAVPQRVRNDDGSWSARDLALAPAADGTLRPAASVADVRFSPGGTGPAVTAVADGKRLELSWPGALPKPAVTGDSAVYAGVLSGVDLVLRATPTGFTHVLVVRTPEAADDARVRQVGFTVGGDARLVEDPDGGLRAIAGDVEIASADKPIMWDSAAPAAAATARAARSNTPAGSTHAQPGEAATVREMAAEVTAGGDLRLVPDASLLDAPKERFPLYIDPAWSTGKSRWAYATSNNSNNNVHNVWVGLNPSTGVTHRSFFVFPTSAIKGKHIESAYVQMKLEHSWSCSDEPTSMYWAGGLSGAPRTAWATGLKGWMATVSSHANEAGGCGTIQPDPWNNFQGSAVTSRIQAIASGGASDITIAFTGQAQNGTLEHAQARWKRFSMNDAKLIVDFDTPPAEPTGLRPAGNGSGCGTIGTLNATFQAVPQDADGHAQSVEWEWAEVSASGAYTTQPAPGRTTASAGGLAQAASVRLTEGRKYAFRARSTDPAPYSITGPWSAWCEFVADISRPAQPTITMTTPPTGPGTPVVYTITSTESDVTKFRFGWAQTAVAEVTATTSGALKTATVKLTAPKYGLINLYAYAVDATLNDGVLGKSEDFIVDRKRPAVARFGLETYPGINESAALADQQAALAGDTPLTTVNTTWTDNGRLVNGRTLTFGNTAAQATAPGLVPDMTKSFSVAAWVKLNDLNGFQTVVAKDAAAGQWSPFRLQMRTDTGGPSWCMTLNARVDHGSALSVCSPVKPVAARWMHVAGAWDATDGKIRVWVDGSETNDTFLTPVSTTGALVVGRATNAGAAADQLRGSVADVQFFDRVLVKGDFTGVLPDDPESGGVAEPGMLTPLEVGNWDFEGAGWCYEEGAYQSADRACQAPDATAFNRRLSMTTGAGLVAGRDGSNALQLNDVHFVDDPSDPRYGTGTAERAHAQWNTAAAGQPETWVHSPVARTDQSFTVAAWLRPDQLPYGTHTAISLPGNVQATGYIGIRTYTVDGVTQRRWAISTQDADAVTGRSGGVSATTNLIDEDDLGAVWTHVTAVFDASTKTVRLYLNGDLAGTGTWAGPWPTAGPFTLGAGRYSATAGATTGQWVDQWRGAIDDVHVFQGAATDSAVRTLFDAES